MIQDLITRGFKFRSITLRRDESGIIDLTIEAPGGTACHGEGVNLEYAVINCLSRIQFQIERYLEQVESEGASLKYQLKETDVAYQVLRHDYQTLTEQYLAAQKQLTSVGSAHNELKIHHQELLNDLSASAEKIAELELHLQASHDELQRWITANTAIALELSLIREAKAAADVSINDMLSTYLGESGHYDNGSFEVTQESPTHSILIDAEDNPCIIHSLTADGKYVLAAITTVDDWSTIQAIRNGKNCVKIVYDNSAWEGDVNEMSENVGTGKTTLMIMKTV